MDTFAVAMVRDEADLVEGWVRHTVGEVDHLLVADNRSIDGTREILVGLVAEGLPVTLADDLDPAFRQSEKMSELAARAAGMGADWIVPADADELWVSRFGRVGDVLNGCAEEGFVCAYAELYDHYRTRLDIDDEDPFRAMVYRRRDPADLRKVAFRWQPSAVIEQGNHGVDLPRPGPAMTPLEVRHFPFRSAAQMTRKALNGAEALRLTDLPETSGAHWRQYGALIDRDGPDAMRIVFETHFSYYSPTDNGLILDPAPYMRWQQP